MKGISLSMTFGALTIPGIKWGKIEKSLLRNFQLQPSISIP